MQDPIMYGDFNSAVHAQLGIEAHLPQPTKILKVLSEYELYDELQTRLNSRINSQVNSNVDILTS